MSKAIPTIQKYMTTSPHSIRGDMTLQDAHVMMRKYQIRHLPVLEEGVLRGLVSDRDLKLIETLRDVDPAKVTVEEAMSDEVFTVSPDDMLDRVASTMASKKYGSAVVVHNHKVVGMFTTTDALTALSDLLHTRLSS